MGQFLSPDEQKIYFPNIWRANQLRGTTFALPWYVVLLSTTVSYCRDRPAAPNLRRIVKSGTTNPRSRREVRLLVDQVTDVAPQITGSTGKKSAAVTNVAVTATFPPKELAIKFAQFLTNDAN